MSERVPSQTKGLFTARGEARNTKIPERVPSPSL